MEYIKIQPLNEDDWLEKRKKYITATQSIFAIRFFAKDENFKELANKYNLYDCSLYKFFMEKTLTKEENELYKQLKIEKEYFKAGQDLESEVANIGFNKIKQENKEYQQQAIIKPNGRTIWTFADANVMATPDYIINNNGKEEILECKTTAYDITKTYYVNKLLNYYYFQVQQQLLCCGLDVAWLVICNKDKTGNNLTGDCKIFKIEKNEVLFQTILQASKDCIKWIQQEQNKTSIALKPNLLNYDEVILDAVKRKALKEYIYKYKDNILSLKENEKIEENIITLCKHIAINNIAIEGVNIELIKTKEVYYDENSIDKEIEDLEQKINNLKFIKNNILKGERVLKRKGSVRIKNIY